MPATEGDGVMQVVLIKRKADLSREQFSKYYREVHGPLVTSLQGVIGFDYYEQWHTVGDEASTTDRAGRLRKSRGMPATSDYDAVAVLW